MTCPLIWAPPAPTQSTGCCPSSRDRPRSGSCRMSITSSTTAETSRLRFCPATAPLLVPVVPTRLAAEITKAPAAEDQAGHQGRDLRQGPGASVGAGLPAGRPAAGDGAAGTAAHRRQGRHAVGTAAGRAEGLRQRTGRAAGRRSSAPDFATVRRRLSLLCRAARWQQERHQRRPRQARHRGRRRTPRGRAGDLSPAAVVRVEQPFRLAHRLHAATARCS